MPVLLLTCLLVACNNAPPGPPAVEEPGSSAPLASMPSAGASASASGPAASPPAGASLEREPALFPEATEPVPRRAPRLATRLERVTVALRASVDAWIASGTTATGRPPRRVTLQALYQQRIYRLLSRRPDLAREVVGRLPRALAREAGAIATAGMKLRSLVTPLDPRARLQTGRAEPAGRLLRYYKRAERRFGVAWQVLAAVNYVETKFNRVRSSSSAGAQGPMQFLPATWDAYGLGGDLHHPPDAIAGAANYLSASGAPGDYRGALYNYNHSDAYVDAVLLYARRMRVRPENSYQYYSWQVFVITTEGDERLTGPGLRR